MNGSSKKKIKVFIVENFLFGEDNGLKDETSFLDEGIIDSTGILELVDFLEQEFNITVEDEELIPENLDTIANVDNFISGNLPPENRCTICRQTFQRPAFTSFSR